MLLMEHHQIGKRVPLVYSEIECSFLQDVLNISNLVKINLSHAHYMQ